MSVNKTKNKSMDMKDYFANIPVERKEIVNQLHELILSMYPDAEMSMSFKMPTYKAKDGWIALANQKHYVSLYTCGAHHLAEFKQKHPDIKTGKGCINFKPTEQLPISALKQVIKHAIEHPKPE